MGCRIALLAAWLCVASSATAADDGQESVVTSEDGIVSVLEGYAAATGATVKVEAEGRARKLVRDLVAQHPTLPVEIIDSSAVTLLTECRAVVRPNGLQWEVVPRGACDRPATGVVLADPPPPAPPERPADEAERPADEGPPSVITSEEGVASMLAGYVEATGAEVAVEAEGRARKMVLDLVDRRPTLFVRMVDSGTVTLQSECRAVVRASGSEWEVTPRGACDRPAAGLVLADPAPEPPAPRAERPPAGADDGPTSLITSEAGVASAISGYAAATGAKVTVEAEGRARKLVLDLLTQRRMPPVRLVDSGTVTLQSECRVVVRPEGWVWEITTRGACDQPAAPPPVPPPPATLPPSQPADDPDVAGIAEAPPGLVLETSRRRVLGLGVGGIPLAGAGIAVYWYTVAYPASLGYSEWLSGSWFAFDVPNTLYVAFLALGPLAGGLSMLEVSSYYATTVIRGHGGSVSRAAWWTSVGLAGVGLAGSLVTPFLTPVLHNWNPSNAGIDDSPALYAIGAVSFGSLVGALIAGGVQIGVNDRAYRRTIEVSASRPSRAPSVALGWTPLPGGFVIGVSARGF